MYLPRFSAYRWRRADWHEQTRKYRTASFLFCCNIIVSRDVRDVLDSQSILAVYRSSYAQTDKTVPSGLPASLVWFTVYEISRGFGKRMLLIQDHNKAEKLCGERDFLCVEIF